MWIDWFRMNFSGINDIEFGSERDTIKLVLRVANKEKGGFGMECVLRPNNAEYANILNSVKNIVNSQLQEAWEDAN